MNYDKDLVVILAPTFRVFETEVYESLQEVKGALLGGKDVGISFSGKRNPDREMLDSILEKVEPARKAAVTEILKQLFPPAGNAFGGSAYGAEFRHEWMRDMRVCHPELFDRYFLLNLPRGDIGHAQIETILSVTGSRDAFTNELKALQEQKLLGVCLERLESYAEQMDLDHAENVVAALFDVGDSLDFTRRGPFGATDEIQANRVIFFYLRRLDDPERRAEVLKLALEASTGLYLPVMRLSLETPREGKKRNEHEFLLTDDGLNQLRPGVIDRIRQAAASGSLSRHPRMIYILYRWLGWTAMDEVQKWVASLIESDDGLLAFLRAATGQVTSHGMEDHVALKHSSIDLKDIESFVSLDVVKEKVASLNREALAEGDVLAVDAFVRAIERQDDPRGWPT